MQLFKNKLVTYETALNAATNPDDFALHVRGIGGTSDMTFDME
jgi:twitching motility protein PilT